MSQIFRPGHNSVARVSIVASVIGVLLLGGVAWTLRESSYNTGKDVALEQPVPFSHQHHVKELGIDCRYCHGGVETTAYAGMPPTHTCMSCHSQIWTTAALLRPIRESYRDRIPVQWNQVYRLPDYVYFNHSIHVQKGIGCTSCHSQIDQMAMTWKSRTFWMKDCLSCHREPEKYIRPKEEVFNLDWPSENRGVFLKEGERLVRDNQIPTHRLTNCTVCHR
jgi:hypothetical protein